VTSPDSAFETLIDAAVRGDIAAIREQIAAGFDLRATAQYGESVLAQAISVMEVVVDTPLPHRYEVISTLLELGFDPNQLDPDGAGPLTEAMLAMDTDMIRLLLDAGARPNDVSGFFPGDTLYEWAEISYLFHVWDVNGFPQGEEPTEGDARTKDDWLAWLDRMAIKHNLRRPNHLFLLREREARTKQELTFQPAQNPARIEPLKTAT
jgi:hypothetical protein